MPSVPGSKRGRGGLGRARGRAFLSLACARPPSSGAPPPEPQGPWLHDGVGCLTPGPGAFLIQDVSPQAKHADAWGEGPAASSPLL